MAIFKSVQPELRGINAQFAKTRSNLGIFSQLSIYNITTCDSQVANEIWPNLENEDYA